MLTSSSVARDQPRRRDLEPLFAGGLVDWWAIHSDDEEKNEGTVRIIGQWHEDGSRYIVTCPAQLASLIVQLPRRCYEAEKHFRDSRNNRFDHYKRDGDKDGVVEKVFENDI